MAAAPERKWRILLLGETCNPEWPSLPVVSYKYAKALAAVADVTLVTQIRNKPAIDRVGLGKGKVVYIDTEWLASPIDRLSNLLRGGKGLAWTIKTAMDYPTYVAFEQAVWQQFRSSLQAGAFDVVHRITPMTPTNPSPIASKCPVPFILGPLNGGLAFPQAFKDSQRQEREGLRHLRDSYKLLPFYRSTYAQSSAILAAFDHTIADLPAAVAPKTINFPEVGIDPELFSATVRPQSDRKTILYAGRLVPYKLPSVAIEAVAASPLLQQHRLVIVGGGPERSKLEQLIADHQLQHCVELVGEQSQAQVGNWMRQSDIFAFPSIRELGAGVVIEAMACGMACVVVDYGGCGTLVGADRGVKVPMGNMQKLIAGFQQELEALVQEPERIQRLGQAAHEHAMTYYSWNVKAQKTLEVYGWVVDQHGAKPDFWQPTVEKPVNASVT